MATVRDHYDHHLGPIYAWMIGDRDAAIERARTHLDALGLADGRGRRAIDLGSGPGVYAMALAQTGYEVTALDTCAPLLAELSARAADLPITCINDDLGRLLRHGPVAPDVILCMGDTLPHLESPAEVERLFDAIAQALGPDGVFVATFRDYAGRIPEEAGRFVQVRQDDRRILTCVLEYGDTRVTVYDLLHERTATGWTLRVSSYAKLRLDPAWAAAALERRTLTTRLGAGPAGMVQLVARRP